MELYLLRTFIAVAETRHVTRASETLHLSQPTVSGQIRMLEHELGVRLFERGARGVTLTAPSERLLPMARRIVEAALEFTASAKNMGDRLSGKIRIGTIIHPDLVRLADITSRMRTSHPRVDLEFQHGISGWVIESLKRRTLDAGFFVGPVPRARITARHLTDLPLCMIAPAEFRDRIAHATWRDIASLPWIWTPKLGAYHQIASRMFRARKLKPNIVMEADRESTLLNLVIAGMGLSLMRTEVAQSAMQAGKVVVWNRGTITPPLSFVTLRERSSEPSIQALAAEVARVWRTASKS